MSNNFPKFSKCPEITESAGAVIQGDPKFSPPFPSKTGWDLGLTDDHS